MSAISEFDDNLGAKLNSFDDTVFPHADKKESEIALAKSGLQLKLVLEGANDGFWDWDLQSGLVEFSKRLTEMIGYRLEEFDPHVSFWKGLIHPDDRTGVLTELEKHFRRNTERYIREYRVQTKDGSWAWILDRGKVVEWDELGKPKRMVGTHADINEKKKSEEKLLFRELFEKLINEVSTTLINISLPEIDSKIEELLSKIGQFIGVDRSYVFLLDANRSGMSNTHEWCRNGIRAEKENLQNIPLSVFPWWMSRINSNQTIAIESVEKLPEEAAAEKAILENQRIKSALVVPLINQFKVVGFVGFDAVTSYRSWDNDTELLLKNAAITIVNAIQRKEHETAIDQYKNHLEAIIQERTKDLEASNQALNRSLLKLEQQNQELVKFKNIADKANYPILLSSKGQGIYCDQKKSRIAGVSTDVKRELKLETEMLHSEKMRSLGTLAGGIAHDFNNILQIVQINSDLIDYYEKTNAEVGKSTNQIKKACQRGKSLVGNILNFSRQEPREMVPYNFESLINEIIQIARTIYPPGVEIKFDLQEVGVVECEPTKIQQIIFNLLNNAFDAMDQRGTVLVELRKLADSEKDSLHNVLLKISHCGKGMDKEVLDRLYDPFCTTKPVGRGMEPGLSTVLEIVKEHNARINVASAIGNGTDVSIRFFSK